MCIRDSTMTEDLRANMATSHIPVVLLTAKTDMDSKLEGMELGVEDYITKPFSATYLKARVETVSYTHLCVMKRRMICRCFIRN